MKKLSKAQIALKESFIRLMKSAEYDNISVSDIVNASGYSRRAFYTYYQDKYDFVKQLMDYEMQTYVDIICSPILASGRISLDSSIYPPALDFFNHVYENQMLYHIIINDQIPEYNCETFCQNANAYFLSTLSLEMDSSIWGELNYNFYTYIGTYTFMLYVKFWENNKYSFPPEYMARQVTLMIQLKKIDAVKANPH